MSDVLDRIAESEDPSKVLGRLIVESACVAVAKDHEGKVHASWVRPLLPRWLGPVYGAAITAMVRSGALVATGQTLPLEGYKNRNGTRPSKVYRLISEKVDVDVMDPADFPETDPFPPRASEAALTLVTDEVDEDVEDDVELSYAEFIAAKADLTADYGFEVSDDQVHPMLFPHQRDIVRWAVKGGRRAIFAAFGLGKSFMQLEAQRLCLDHEGPDSRGLIVCPLGVRQEFKADAGKLGIEIRFVQSDAQIDGPGLYLTNYESVREEKISVSQFEAVSLDEASILRGFGTKTFQTFLPLFSEVKYRFVATATPSPNRYKELIHYAGFLGVMDTGQALTRFFKRDSTKANNLTLYPHMEAQFWLWLHSWAIFLQKPSDLGYSDEGYDLPPLTVNWHKVAVDQTDVTADRDGQQHLYRDAALGLQDAAREKRLSIGDRVARAAEIIAESPDDHFILWHDLEDERRAIKRAVPEAVEVYGSQDLDLREQRIIDFSDGQSRILATKPVIAGSGCNFQRHCHRAIFVGAGFKFNDFIQAVHRIHRFLQDEPVVIDIIYAESEAHVVEVLMEKWRRHDELTRQMQDLIRELGLAATGLADLGRSASIERVTAEGQGWFYANNDTVAEARLIDTDSVGMVVTSIPFANHYEYTPSLLDFGHTDSNDHFWAQMDHLTPELLRILKPGRIYACHTKDRILFGAATGKGVPTVSPFHMEATAHALKHGFDYLGMITVVTDVVRENNQTYRLSYGAMLEDATVKGVGSPEYILLFRKPQSDRSQGFADERVTHDPAEYSLARWQVDAHAFWRSSGNRHLTPQELADLDVGPRAKAFEAQSLAEVYDYEEHVAAGDLALSKNRLPKTWMNLAPGSASPNVWHDVNRMLTLNGAQSNRNLANHVCLARGSKVLTRERGYVPIEDVRIGEHALTHKGRWKPVLAVQNTGVRGVVKIEAQGVPGLTLTPDHKLWARDPRRFKRQTDYLPKVEADWLEAGKSLGAYVNLKLPAESSADGDTCLWWNVGRWLANGHRGACDEAIVSIGADKWDDFAARVGRFGGGNPRDLSARQLLLRDPGRELRAILDKCGSGAAGKHLPPEAFTLPLPLARALLEGYLSGDGHLVPGRDTMSACSVSRDLLLGFALVVQRVHGSVASIYAGREPRRHVIEGREVNARQEWVMTFPIPKEGRRKRQMILEDGAWKKVRRVTPAGEAETWNLRVADDASFTAEGCIVKNCPLQFDIVDRLIERYSNRGDLVYDPFGGLGTVPVRALKLGREGRGVELNADYYRDAVYYLEQTARELATPDLFSLLDLEATA